MVYADEITGQLTSGCTVENLEPVDFSLARMKCLGAQWLVNLVDHLSGCPEIIVNGFMASGITPSIDAREPVVDDKGEAETDEEETDYEEEETEDEDETDDDKEILDEDTT